VLRQLRFVTLLKTTFLLSLTFFEAAQSGFPALLSSSTAAYQPVHISARKQQQNNNQWSKNVDERPHRPCICHRRGYKEMVCCKCTTFWAILHVHHLGVGLYCLLCLRFLIAKCSFAVIKVVIKESYYNVSCERITLLTFAAERRVAARAAAPRLVGARHLPCPAISQVIGCEDSLRNDLYCVEWGVKLYSNQPTSARTALSSKPAARRSCSRIMGKTDGRTDGCTIVS